MRIADKRAVMPVPLRPITASAVSLGPRITERMRSSSLLRPISGMVSPFVEEGDRILALPDHVPAVRSPVRILPVPANIARNQQPYHNVPAGFHQDWRCAWLRDYVVSVAPFRMY